jgi:Zn-dependent protease
MPEYLKLDSRRVTFREYWNLTRSPSVIIPWVAKLLNIPIKLASGFQRVDAVQELEVAATVFSAAAREKLQPWLDQCLTLGFHSPRFFCFKTLDGDTETSFITLLHGSGECSVRLMYAVSTRGTISKSNALVAMLSELYDDTFLVTTNQRARFLTPPGITVHRLVNAHPDRLLELHQRKLAKLQVRNHAKTVSSMEELDATWNRYEKLNSDHGIRRGIFVPLKAEEHEAALKKTEAVKAFKAQGVENADVLAALNQVQEKKRGWGSAILIFIVSMALFVGAGARQWTWQYVLMLVPILFVHELGHYVAMRAFNYRNLRMFFIPFFGAAVSGRNYNVPGWKKVVVSMMGPVPGIILGALIGSVGLVLHQDWLIKVALVALILNGFNLLPVLPMDGGWIFHTLIFSRHYLLDAAFRVIAAIALMLLGMYSGTKILMYLGIPMLLGIPVAYRLARVVATLRKRGVPPASADDQTIPAETAQTIIAELKQVLPKMHTPKMVAEQTLQVFETLNARPPGWLASIGLLLAHLGSLAIAVVFAVVLFVGQHGGLSDILTAAQASRHKIACGSITVWRGEQTPAIGVRPQNTLIATFSKSSAAETAFHTLTNLLPDDAVLKIFGETMLLSLPLDDADARRQWLAWLQEQTKDVFVENTDFPAMLSLACLAPTEQAARELEGELQEYLNTLPNQFLAPPWLPNDPRSAAQRAQHRLARQTYLKLTDHSKMSYETAEFIDLQKKMTEARKQGDKAALDAVYEEMQQITRDAERKRIAMIRAGQQGPVDSNVIDLFAAQQAAIGVVTNREALLKPYQDLARLMGQVPLVDEQPSPEDACFLARFGAVTRKQMLLNLSWISFEQVSEGAPALIEWLCANGCSDIRYGFHAGTGIGDD